jgi:hypothetical protein
MSAEAALSFGHGSVTDVSPMMWRGMKRAAVVVLTYKMADDR